MYYIYIYIWYNTYILHFKFWYKNYSISVLIFMIIMKVIYKIKKRKTKTKRICDSLYRNKNIQNKHIRDQKINFRYKNITILFKICHKLKRSLWFLHNSFDCIILLIYMVLLDLFRQQLNYSTILTNSEQNL